MALSGSSKKLGDAIRKFFSKAVDKKMPEQAHHLLASSVVIALDTEFYKLCPKGNKKRFADKAKYQLNGQPNGILLPIRFGHQMKNTLVRHRGRHGPPYFKEVDTALRKIYEDVIKHKKDVCGKDQAAFLAAFTVAEDDIRSRITGNPPSLWLYEKWSEKLWTENYKDEGATVGQLRRTTGIVDDAAAGLEWAKLSPVRRRHTMTGPGKTAVFNSKWYSDRGYPPPAGNSLY